jgi:hypothetical protein
MSHGRTIEGRHTVQRLHSAFCRIETLLNWCVTARIRCDILVEAMPVVCFEKSQSRSSDIKRRR